MAITTCFWTPQRCHRRSAPARSCAGWPGRGRRRFKPCWTKDSMSEPWQRGAGLCQRFYWQAVRPILEAHFPGLAHAAALIDTGSEVLGFDDEQSTDHHWGPRALLFLSEADHRRLAASLQQALAHELPLEFEGYPTSF